MIFAYNVTIKAVEGEPRDRSRRRSRGAVEVLTLLDQLLPSRVASVILVGCSSLPYLPSMFYYFVDRRRLLRSHNLTAVSRLCKTKNCIGNSSLHKSFNRKSFPAICLLRLSLHGSNECAPMARSLVQQPQPRRTSLHCPTLPIRQQHEISPGAVQSSLCSLLRNAGC